MSIRGTRNRIESFLSLSGEEEDAAFLAGLAWRSHYHCPKLGPAPCADKTTNTSRSTYRM